MVGTLHSFRGWGVPKSSQVGCQANRDPSVLTVRALGLASAVLCS